MQEAHTSRECAVKALIRTPAVEPLPDRGMADFLCAGLRINPDWNTFPLATGVELVQNVVEDAPERNFQLFTAFGQ